MSAIRCLDLSQCSEVDWDPTLKQHCFKLVFPWRTFWMFAHSRQEAEEWVDLLDWKVSQLSQGAAGEAAK